MNRLQMLLARLSPKHRLGSSYSYQSIITSCARNIITSTGNHVADRLVASRQISCHSIARVWPSSVFDCRKTSEYVKIFFAGDSNFDLRGSVRFYGRHNRIDFRHCETVDDALQLALDQGDYLSTAENAAMWSSVFRLLSKDQQRKVVHKENAAQLELLFWDILEVTMDSLPRMRPRDLTTIILQLAKISNRVSSKHYKRLSASELALKNILLDERSIPQYSIFDPLAEAANQILVDFEPRYLSNLAYAYSLLGYDPRIDDDATLLENIADASLDCIQQFNAYDIANMMWAYTKLNVSHEPLFQAVGDAIAMKDDLKTFKPQDLSNTVWAYATANNQHHGLFKKVGDEIVAMDNLKSFDPQALANTMWAYATANIHHPDLFKKVGDEVVAMDDLASFDAQNLSNIAWAYATANVKHPALFKKVGDEIAKIDDLKSFNPQALANIVWAYATSNLQHPGLFKKVADEIVAMDDLKTFDPQNISNIVWSYATAHEQHIELFKKIADEIVAMDSVKSFDPQDLSNTVWAYATANIQHPALFKKVGDEVVAMDDLKSFVPQNLANTVWAFATANVQHPGLFVKVGDELALKKDLKSFKPQEIANIVWAYASANIHHPDLFEKVGDEIAAMDFLEIFNPQAKANIVWAYATTNIQHPALFEKVANEIVVRDDCESFNSQNLSNIAWAYTVANLDPSLLFHSVFRQELLNHQNEFVDEELRQLHQWHLWQTKEKSNAGLPDSLCDRCKRTFLSAGTRSSSLQNDVVSELTSIGLNPIEEYLTKSGYSIDALVEINGKKVGVEVDGPSHFMGRRPNGRTLLKRRQVETIDQISLVSVPYWEWNKLGKDRDKKQRYLKALLKLTT
eukprot:scaffold60399_cov70-Cyclotella_meneghiniana.AAC.2